MSLETRKNPAYGRSSLYSFSSKAVNSKARQEVGTSRRLCAAQERETSPSNSSAFAVHCKRGYQQCPTILRMSEFDRFSSWEPGRKCLSQVPSQPRGAALMRGRRLQVSRCLRLAAAAPPAAEGRRCFCSFIFLSPLDFAELCLRPGKAAGPSPAKKEWRKN